MLVRTLKVFLWIVVLTIAPYLVGMFGEKRGWELTTDIHPWIGGFTILFLGGIVIALVLVICRAVWDYIKTGG